MVKLIILGLGWIRLGGRIFLLGLGGQIFQLGFELSGQINQLGLG